MLITQVKMNQDLVVGEFVQWSADSQEFVRCTDGTQMIGVVDQPPQLRDGSYVGVIRQAGVANALAGEDIVASGGELGINENGRAIISTGYSCGLIQAQPIELPARVEGDLIVVWLR